MELRRAFAVVNVTILVAALAVELLRPQYAPYVAYIFLYGLVATLVLLFARPAPGAARTVGPPATAPGSPLPAGGPATTLDFCVYCGTPYPPGATACAACGRAARPI